MDSIDCAVIGGGVVGLAIARALALAGRETLILESADRFGSGISSRNSEVIHAGIYYPQGSLKARLCLAGRALLYEYSREHGIEHRRCGKLIVATTPGQLAALDGIARAAAANGVGDLVRLDTKAAQALEPALSCTAALLSPSTGIVDTHGFMLSLLGEAQGAGADIAYLSAVTRLRPGPDGIEISINDEPEPSLRARLVVNATGLAAQDIARRIAGFPPQHIPAGWYAKGSYFSLIAHAPFSRLVYPVPEPGGLGIHLTLDLAGQARFGPDVEWVDAPDYQIDPARAAAFYPAIRTYWPDLPDGALAPAYAGIRPKLSGPGAPPADFRIDGPATHGVPGIIHLFGIESPGLTASLAIAEHVAAMANGT